MKLTIERDVLLDGLSAVKPAIGKGTPIHGCVLIVASGDQVQLATTDGEIRTERTLAAQVEEPETVAVDCSRLHQTVSLADDGEIILGIDGDMLVIQQAFNEQRLPTLNADAFPDWKAGDSDAESFEADAATLSRAFRSTIFASTTDSERNGLCYANAVQLLASAKEITVVGTNSKHLAIMRWKEDGPEKKRDGIVPAKVVQVVTPLLDSEGGKVRVELARSTIGFHADGWSVRSRLKEGRYPPFESILPKKFDHEVTLSRGLFLARTRQAANVANAEEDTRRVAFDFGGGRLKLNCETVNGKAAAEMPINSDVKLSIVFDPKLLIEFLRNLDADTVQFKANAHNKPALFVASDDYQYLLMPCTD